MQAHPKRLLRLSRRLVALVLCAAPVAACASASPPDVSAQDSSIVGDGSSGTDGLGAGDSTPPIDGFMPGDASGFSVRCGSDTPRLVVVQPNGGGNATTLLRLSLLFSGTTTDVTITSVTQLSGTTGTSSLRDWPVALLRPPAGFTGTVAAMPGNPNPSLRFTATAPSLDVETMACARRAWERPAGLIRVVGSTRVGGAFTLDCDYGLNLGGRGPEPLRFACARGTAGWLGGAGSQEPGVHGISTPIVAVIGESGVHFMAVTASALSGITVTDGTLNAHNDSRAGLPGSMCPRSDPAPWTTGSGRHTLWRGADSTHTWSGPVSPGAQEDAHWLFQQNGAVLPSGFCVLTSPDPESCPPPVLQLTLRGTSSIGAWEFESDLVQCIERR